MLVFLPLMWHQCIVSYLEFITNVFIAHSGCDGKSYSRSYSLDLLAAMNFVLVTFLLLWSDTIVIAIYRRKGLFGIYSSWETTVHHHHCGEHGCQEAGIVLEQQLRTDVLTFGFTNRKQKEETLNGQRLIFWNLKACPQWYISCSKSIPTNSPKTVTDWTPAT